MQQSFGAGDQFQVRELNLSSVLRILQSQAPLSRAQVAKSSGLNKSTISSLVEDLIARGLLHETGLNPGAAGRPGTLLELNPRSGCIIGVEFGVDFIAVALTDFGGGVLWRRDVPADPRETQESLMACTLGLVDEALAQSGALDLPLLGLGVTIPGTVNQDGVLVFAPNLQWRDVPLQQIFSRHTGLRVFVENDANAAALAEHLFGVARQVRNFIFIFAGYGLGGGLFLNGELYRGVGGYAGEIGHSSFMVESFQNICQCGNRGCWEMYANQYSIIERVRARMEARRASLIPQMVADQQAPLSLAIVTQAADAGDAEALEALEEAGIAMGLGVANLVNIFNPEMVVIGGPLSAAGKYLLPAVRSAVARRAMPDICAQTEIALSDFGPDASIIGAVALVIDDALSHPTHIERRWTPGG